MQPPAVGGWVYWMLSDPKQRSMVPALDSVIRSLKTYKGRRSKDSTRA